MVPNELRLNTTGTCSRNVKMIGLDRELRFSSLLWQGSGLQLIDMGPLQLIIIGHAGIDAMDGDTACDTRLASDSVFSDLLTIYGFSPSLVPSLSRKMKGHDD